MFRSFSSIAIAMTLGACATTPRPADGPPFVHIDTLTWEPAKYDGQTVVTRGYLLATSVDRGLYATYCGTVDPPTTKRALYFREPPKMVDKLLRGTEVEVTGKVVASDRGHLGVFPASFVADEITYVRTMFVDDDRCGK